MTAPIRHHELDLLRTLAVAMMIVYHAAFDLRVFYGWSSNVFDGPWMLMARVTATLFLLLVGCSFAISWHRGPGTYQKYLKRGALLLVCATLVSTATALVDPVTYVRFGVLHCIAISILLLPLVAKLEEWTALLGVAILAASVPLSSVAPGSPLLLPIGVMPAAFQSVDYFPLIPWFGVVLIGYALGHLLYVRFPRPENHLFSHIPRWMTWPGKRALWIYLGHQPVLLGIFGILGFFGFL